MYPLCTIDSHFIFYCSLLKSIDRINFENMCEYFADDVACLVGRGGGWEGEEENCVRVCVVGI